MVILLLLICISSLKCFYLVIIYRLSGIFPEIILILYIIIAPRLIKQVIVNNLRILNLWLIPVRHCIPARIKILYLSITHRIKIILIWCNTIKVVLIKKIKEMLCKLYIAQFLHIHKKHTRIKIIAKLKSK